ncbi:PRC-barrel domain-containing protein [Pseudogemmobacter bohemicus]|uniref:PRC-barrel domain-containing protein n=1 Tax=Pseudogemmobacter bohemicus TaxID=2250708 RepID=UPI0013002B8A|nr:PRC-barrel domain-containing protein [Pseudogemmobacter bohemicus]
MKRIPPFAAPPVIALAASLMLGTAALAQETTTDPVKIPEAGAVDETGAPADPLIEGQPEATPAAPDPATADVPPSPEASEASEAPAALPATDVFAVPEGYSEVTDWTAVTADQLIGATLYASDGSNMGSVTDLVLSTEGPVQGIVADVGGFIGIGTHRVNLGHDQVTLYRDEGGTVIAATTLGAEALKALPAWEPAQ